MTIYAMPMCFKCRRFHKEVDYSAPSCDAFDLIPEAILHNQVDHRLPVDGDGGLQFDPIDAAAADYAEFIIGLAKEPPTPRGREADRFPYPYKE